MDDRGVRHSACRLGAALRPVTTVTARSNRASLRTVSVRTSLSSSTVSVRTLLSSSTVSVRTLLSGSTVSVHTLLSSSTHCTRAEITDSEPRRVAVLCCSDGPAGDS